MSSDEKKQQVLELTPPNEITFEGSYYTEVVTSHLNLRNPTNNTVIFKVKTTAPKQYCVRPNSGVLEPQKEADIAVMLQPFQPNVTDMNKHKFMVQTMFAPPDFVLENLDEVWKKAPKSALMDSKLRCVFVKGEQKTDAQTEEDKQPGQDNEATAVEEGDAYKSILSSPVQEQQPQKTDESASSAIQPTAGSTPGHPGAGGNKNVIESETKDSKIRLLQDKVESLSSENTQLKSEGNKLRQRLSSSGSVAASGKLQPRKLGAPQAQSSSPLSFVAIVLILVAIILGYLVGKSF